MSVSYGGDSIVFADGSVNASGFIGNRNRIINGAMVVDQRYAGSGNTLVTTTETFVVDRFVGYKDGGVITSGQSSVAPAGFTNSISWSVGTGYSATSGQYTFLKQHIEGFNTADLGLGTVDAKTITLSFWVRASVTGTYSGSFTNGAANRGYAWTYTINSANTWEYKTITVPGDTSGTWVGATNGIGLRVYWDQGSGTGARTTAGTWQTGTYTGVTGTTAISATTGATFYITGVQLERGSTASSFEYRSYGAELQLCQRYYEKSFPIGTVPADNIVTSAPNTTQFLISSYAGSSYISQNFNFQVSKRASPTMSFYSNYAINGTNGTAGVWKSYVAGVWTNHSSTASNQSTNTGFMVAGSFTSGGTSFQSYFSAGEWVASAEL